MRTVIALLLLCVPGWGYLYKGTVAFPAASGSGTNTNITLAFTASHASLKTVANSGAIQNTVSRNGVTVPADFVLASDAACTSLYSWEIEVYSATGGTLTGWVLIPSLGTGAGVTVYACWGSVAVSTWQGGAIGAAFDSNTKAVYHMGNGTTLNQNDFSSNANNLTKTNTVNAVSGKVSGAAQFPGTDPIASAGYLSISSPVSTAIGSVTLEAWVNTSDNTKDGQMVLQVGNDTVGSATGYSMAVNKESVTNGHFYLLWNGKAWGDTGQVVPSNAWHHLAATLSSDGKTFTPYYDGSALSNVTNGSAPATPTVATYIGEGNYAGGNRNFKGSIDEVRVSTAIRSAGWIATEYANQSSPPALSNVTFLPGGGAMMMGVQ